MQHLSASCGIKSALPVILFIVVFILPVFNYLELGSFLNPTCPALDLLSHSFSHANFTCPPPTPCPTTPPACPTLPPQVPCPICPTLPPEQNLTCPPSSCATTPPCPTTPNTECPPSSPCPTSPPQQECKICPTVECPKPVEKPDPTAELACVPAIRAAITPGTLAQANDYPQSFLDMMGLLLRYGGTVGARDRFIASSAERGRYFTSTEDLRRRLDQVQTCWKSDEEYGRILDETNPPETKAPRLAVCTTSDSTSPYIQEWMAHYLLMGFHKIILYDGTKEGVHMDNFKAVITPFVELDLVEIVHVDSFDAIRDFEACRIRATAQGFDWVAQVDTDEFLVVHDPLPYCFGEFLQRYDESKTDKKVGGLSFRWRMMTTLGVVRNENNQVLLEEALYQGHDDNAHVKTLYRPSKATQINMEHYAHYIDGYRAYGVDFTMQEESSPFYAPRDTEDFHVAECRHFYGRSLESLIYDKLCADNGNAGMISDRMARFMPWFIHDGAVKIDPPTKYILPLRKFLFG